MRSRISPSDGPASFGPARLRDDVDEVLAVEVWIKVRKDVVVHRAKCRLRPVLHAFVESVLYAILEVWAWVRSGDGCALLLGDLIELLAEYVGLHAEGNEMDLRFEAFGDARSGVKGDRQPDHPGFGRTVSLIQQELPGHVGTVDFESLMPGAVFRCQAEVMEHGADVGEFGVGRKPAAA